ncbi:hypothetical protein Naga_100006g17 [Nannochloropsis gaditana]|uniref:Uncharacterized protein n=1 Tax=Nannochloropsis gaditana TaxID=72520 RepID=W7TQW0_9STRA|nr:hypothetical protein Naga_100006g17 [Nannochloropsis gaditana]
MHTVEKKLDARRGENKILVVYGHVNLNEIRLMLLFPQNFLLKATRAANLQYIFDPIRDIVKSVEHCEMLAAKEVLPGEQKRLLSA